MIPSVKLFAFENGNTVLSGYLVYDDAVTSKRPGVLMAHDRSGFSARTIADAEMIAKLGYVVFAEDMFGKGVVPKSVPEMTDLITIYNNDRPPMRAPWLGSISSGRSQWSIQRSSPRWATASVAPSGSSSLKPAYRFLASFRCTAHPQLRGGSRQEHQGSRPHPARRRRPGRPDGGTQCRDLSVPCRQGGVRSKQTDFGSVGSVQPWAEAV